MGFDDLARHMASRDGKKAQAAPAGDVDQFVAEANELDRRMNRKRDLILGPILLVGGLVILAFIGLYLMDALDPTPSNQRPENQSFLIPIGGTVTAGGMVITGLLQLIRGLKTRLR